MQFVDVNNLTLYVERSGSRGSQSLVFVNSLGSDLRSWADVAHTFPEYDVIRYDKRGHGLSDCPPAPYSIADHAGDLLGLLDALEIDQAILVGISVGGMISMDFSAKHPERVAKLVLLDTFPKIGSAEMWNKRINTIREDGIDSIADAILARWFAPSYAEAHPVEYRAYRNMLMRMPVEGYTGTCEAIRDADLTEAARTIQTSTLVLCGEDDQSLPSSLVSGLVDIVPNAQFVEIKDAGHLPPVENTAATSAAIRAFLQAENTQSKFEAGMSVRRSVLGAAHVERAEANKTAFDADFQRFITEMAWGSVWTRGGIDRVTRHLLTICILASLGKEHELAMHLKATQNTGVTPEQVREVFHQVAIYAGVPAANTAFGIAKKVYQELGIDLDNTEE